MMMHEDDEAPKPGPESSRGATIFDLPTLSRDDSTWKQFQGAENIADIAHSGENINQTTILTPWNRKTLCTSM